MSRGWPALLIFVGCAPGFAPGSSALPPAVALTQTPAPPGEVTREQAVEAAIHRAQDRGYRVARLSGVERLEHRVRVRLELGPPQLGSLVVDLDPAQGQVLGVWAESGGPGPERNDEQEYLQDHAQPLGRP